jgi:hypothetical protein
VYDQNSTPDFAMQSNVTGHVISPSSTTAEFTLQFSSINNFSALKIQIMLSYMAPRRISCTSSPTAPNFGTALYFDLAVTDKKRQALADPFTSFFNE